MEQVKVGIREFRDNLSSYLLESETPVAITRHGDTVGHYIPTPRRKRTEEDRAALLAATEQVKAMMDATNVSEQQSNASIDQLLGDEKRKRRAAR